MTKILISGASLSGNADGRALLDTIAEGIRAGIPDASFTVLCKYPKDDLPLCEKFGYGAYSFTTVQQLLHCVPFYVFGKLWRLLGLNPARLPMSKAIRSYFEHDVMVDLTGISFCDDRSFTGLIINTLWFLPALVSGVDTVKTACSMGPFRKWYVRFAARRVLPSVKALVARGDTSAELTRAFLPGRHIHNLPDVAFCLTPCSSARKDEILRAHGLEGQKYAVIGPSYVVDGLAGHELNMAVFTAAALAVKERTGLKLLLVPHSRAHSAALGVDSASDDANVCRALAARLAARGVEAEVLDEILDAHELKGVIGGAEFAIASRYHLLIASVSSGVPSLALGWSHKYEDMFRLFGLEKWAVKYGEFSEALAKEKTLSFLENIRGIKAALDAGLPGVCAQSRKNSALICELLKKERSADEG